ncbi:AMP-dependent synthetase [Bailinhaonella thermotolerans]|uniref:AMP-dependent synthetase n=1 Tax=Bailinhaonella thermotolerans TaxID=1070861 RepID=A0A3A4B049_9ACTN|nr:AMP-dependent synthetase [Bailinhaonella thermotolerans]
MLAWIGEPADGRGIRFAAPGGEWDFWPYPRLASLTEDVAAGLRRAGVEPGDVVCLVQRPGPGFVAALFGAMLAGATPAPIAPPAVFQDPGRYREHYAGLVATARPALVLTEPDLVPRLGPLAPGVPPAPLGDLLAGRPSVRRSPQRAGREPYGGRGPDALLQFTSGSSGRARGVRVPYRALEANVAAIHAWLEWTPRDPVASWLPVHHDMGLIGCLICPVARQSDLWSMPPEDFVRDPRRYLACFGELGARLTAMPGFGLAHIARKVPPAALAGLDFRDWRAAIIGAEPLDPEAFERFAALLAPHGFAREALLPAYGLAEATLAVTGLPLREGWTSVRVLPGSLAPGSPVRLGPEGVPVMGCGRPLGVEVGIRAEDGTPIPGGTVGEIVVRGPSVADGYAAEPGGSTRFDGDALLTGDAGFLLEDRLYVLGRLGDGLKIRGRMVFAEDLEAELARAGVPAHRVAAALGHRRAEPTVLLVLDRPRPGWPGLAREVLRRRTEGARVVVAAAPIPRTTSGKPRRRELWHAFLSGGLGEAPHEDPGRGERDGEDRTGEEVAG